MIDVDAAIGAQLERLRSARSWSVQELSDRANVSGADLISWETGSERVSAADLHRLVKALGCRVKDIYQPVTTLIGGVRQSAEVFGAQRRDL